MSLQSLPPEITLHIISYLPISCFPQLQVLSRTWNSFFGEHESTIYQKAAAFHGMIESGSTTFIAPEWRTRFSERVLAGVKNWKEFCQRRFRLRRAWNGDAASVAKPKGLIVNPHGEIPREIRERVHRIKVDERRRIIITTSGVTNPIIVVRDLETGNVRWYITPTNGRIFSHLEYSNGFFIFDRPDGAREVWRLANHTEPAPHAERPPEFNPEAVPDSAMLADSLWEQKAHRHLLGPNPLCAYFEPYALLRDPGEARASRFCYPTLLAAANDKVYVWDIPTARIVQIVQGVQEANLPDLDAIHASETTVMSEDEPSNSAERTQPQETDLFIWTQPLYFDDDEMDDEWEEDTDDEDSLPPLRPPKTHYRLRTIHYVDHDAKHIFLAGQYVLKIFSKTARKTSKGEHDQLVFMLPSSKLRYGHWRYVVDPDSRHELRPLDTNCALVQYNFNVSGEDMDRNPKYNLYDEFKAVHVSPCGSHFAVLLKGARLLIVPHFSRLFGQPEELVYKSIIDVQIASPTNAESIYLAYEEGDGGDGRIGVVTTRGVFIVTFPSFQEDHSSEVPHSLRISRLKEYTNPDYLAHVSCLMISDSYLYITYSQSKQQSNQSELQGWDHDFEEGLRDFKRNDLLSSYMFSMDALFIQDSMDANTSSDYGCTVHTLDLLPDFLFDP